MRRFQWTNGQGDDVVAIVKDDATLDMIYRRRRIIQSLARIGLMGVTGYPAPTITQIDDAVFLFTVSLGGTEEVD